MSHNEKRPDPKIEPSSELVSDDDESRDKTKSITADAARAYLDSGLGTPLRLPAGAKYPPPEGTTGWKNPRPTVDEALAMLDGHTGNLALRVADGVIGVDVDEYGDKHGCATMREMVAKLGPLPDTYISTSRDPESGSGIYWFRVPPGFKLKGKIGADVEIIQPGHRYAVVAPSVAEGRVYRWYGPDLDECERPNADDLAELPTAWFDHYRGAAVETPVRPALADITDLDEALDWIARKVPGYDRDPSRHMDRQTAPEKLRDDMSAGAHDAMNDRVHEAVQSAAEGHHGLRVALDRVRRAFFAETLGGNDGEARRDLITAELEWSRSVCGEVSKLRADVAAGLVYLSATGGHAAGDLDKIDLDAWRAKMFDDDEDTVTTVDATKYPDSDTGRAQIMLDMLDGRAVAITDIDEHWMLRSSGRWHKMSPGQMHAEVWGRTVTAALRDTADRLWREAEAAQDIGDKDADDLLKQAQRMETRCTKSGDEQQMTRGVRMAHKLAFSEGMSFLAFDADPGTLGATNGIIDIDAYCASGNLDDLLRPASPGDLVTESVGFDFDPHAHSQRVETYLDLFIPGEELRRDVFRVLSGVFDVGNPKRHLPVALGETSTGKSTLVRYIGECLGSYAGSARPSTFFGGGNGPNPEVLDALRLRAVTMSETNSRVIMHGDTLKALTGEDEFSSRYLYSNTVIRQFPRFTPILVTNKLPTITGADDDGGAVFRRLVILPFDQSRPGLVADDGPMTDVDRSHFLRLLIEGRRDSRENKWVEASDLCEQIAEATKVVCAELDPFREWADEMFVEDPNASRQQQVSTVEAWQLWETALRACKVDESLRTIRKQRPFVARMKSVFGPVGKSTRTVKDADGNPVSRYFFNTPIVLRASAESE